MAKAQKKKNSEPISISKIYETIKARDFLQELWWDLISDIKEKPTYKRIKEMVSSLINDATGDFSTEPCSEEERLKRRTMLTEISIMTYTVDTVISEVLFRKLQNEFQLIIANMINDLKAETAASRTAKSGQSNARIENVQKVTDDVSKNQMGGRVKTGPQPKINSLCQTSPEMYAATPNSSAKVGRPRKSNAVVKSNSSVPSTSAPTSKKRGRPPLSSSKRLANKVAEKKSPPKSVKSSNLSKSTPRRNEKASNEVKTEVYDISQDSDAESTVSDGNLSMTSVSSVHTSELSSFEDTISIDGDEESGVKKQIPLKVANDMYLQGTLSQIYAIGKRKRRRKKSLASTYSAPDKSDDANAFESNSLRKVLPQRSRKPNSKYNSETIICEAYPTVSASSPGVNHDAPVSPRHKKQKTVSSDDTNEKSNSVNSSPVRGFSNSLRSPSSRVSQTANHTSPSTSSAKRYDTSDLYKPRTALASSRGSPAFTLFTTLKQ